MANKKITGELFKKIMIFKLEMVQNCHLTQ